MLFYLFQQISYVP